MKRVWTNFENENTKEQTPFNIKVPAIDYNLGKEIDKILKTSKITIVSIAWSSYER